VSAVADRALILVKGATAYKQHRRAARAAGAKDEIFGRV